MCLAMLSINGVKVHETPETVQYEHNLTRLYCQIPIFSFVPLCNRYTEVNITRSPNGLFRNSVIGQYACKIHLCMNTCRNGANNVEAALQLSQPRWSKVGTDDIMRSRR